MPPLASAVIADAASFALMPVSDTSVPSCFASAETCAIWSPVAPVTPFMTFRFSVKFMPSLMADFNPPNMAAPPSSGPSIFRDDIRPPPTAAPASSPALREPGRSGCGLTFGRLFSTGLRDSSAASSPALREAGLSASGLTLGARLFAASSAVLAASSPAFFAAALSTPILGLNSVPASAAWIPGLRFLVSGRMVSQYVPAISPHFQVCCVSRAIGVRVVRARP